MWTLEGGSRPQAADGERGDTSRGSRTREVEARRPCQKKSLLYVHAWKHERLKGSCGKGRLTQHEVN